MSEPHECPRLMEVHRLWEGDLGPIRAGEMRRHLAQCALCRAEVESWDRLSGLMARGDLAQPLVPERRQLMKAALLERCAQSAQEASDPAGRRDMPVLGPCRWRKPLRLALALAPLALVALFWVAARRHVPPTLPPPIATATHPRPAGTDLPPEAPPRRSQMVRNPAEVIHPPAGPVVSRPVVERPRRVMRPRPMARTVTGRAASHERKRNPSSHTLLAAAPSEEQLVPAISSDGADLKPIERILIQVDEPPAARPVESGTVTHITIIAAGDLKAPDAAFTVVKTEKEEAHP